MRKCTGILCAVVLGCGSGMAGADNVGTGTGGPRKDNSTQRIVSPPRTPSNSDAAGTARNGRETEPGQNRTHQTGDADSVVSKDGNSRQ